MRIWIVLPCPGVAPRQSNGSHCARRDQTELAWAYLSAANQLMASASPYGPDADWATVREITRAFSRDMLHQVPSSCCTAA